MDEIDYFPKREKFKVQKDVGSDWNKLKKQKIDQPAKTKPQDLPLRKKKKIDSISTYKLKFFSACLYVFLSNPNI